MSTDSETPLAVYSERLPQVRREFRLYADRVEVEAIWMLGRRYRASVSLAGLVRDPVFFSVRNRWFKNAILIGSLAVAGALVCSRSGYAAWIQQLALLGWPVAGVCLVTAFLTFRKRVFARFRREDGRAGLDVCNTARDRAPFDAFVNAIQSRIRRK